MNSRGELYESIKRALAHLVVFEGDEVISIGTGFVYTDLGDVLTAAHVRGMPVQHTKQRARYRPIGPCVASASCAGVEQDGSSCGVY